MVADYFRHPMALVESDTIGEGTRIWAFAHVLKGSVIGMGCNLCDHTFVEGGAVLGNNVTLKNGVAVWRGVTIEDDVFVGPNAVFTNDKQPRSFNKQWKCLETRVKRGATIGANATLVPGIVIGRYAMVGAGSVVTTDVPDFGLVIGIPAQLRGYVCICAGSLAHSSDREDQYKCGACGRQYQMVNGALTQPACPSAHAQDELAARTRDPGVSTGNRSQQGNRS